MRQTIANFWSLGWLLWAALTAALTATQGITAGVNVPYLNNPTGKASRVDQEVTPLRDFKAAGMRVVRAGIAADRSGSEYAKRLYDQGIRLHWEFGLQYAEADANDS